MGFFVAVVLAMAVRCPAAIPVVLALIESGIHPLCATIEISKTYSTDEHTYIITYMYVFTEVAIHIYNEIAWRYIYIIERGLMQKCTYVCMYV